MADEVRNISSGLTTTKYGEFNQTSLLKGLQRVDSTALALYEPFRPGRHHFFFTKMCKFMEKLDETGTKRFKNIIEFFSIGFDGIQDMTVQTAEFNGGRAGNKFNYLTSVEDPFSEFTIKLPHDPAGLPVLEYLETWITGMHDPITDYTTYHDEEILEELGANISNEIAEGMYVLLDRAGNPIRACMIYGIYPMKSHNSVLNSEHGQYESPAVDITFHGIKRQGIDINTQAKTLVSALKYSKDYLDTKYSQTNGATQTDASTTAR